MCYVQCASSKYMDTHENKLTIWLKAYSMLWMSLVTHMNESRMNESCHTYEWVTSHMLCTVCFVNLHEDTWGKKTVCFEWVMSHVLCAVCFIDPHEDLWGEKTVFYEWVISQTGTTESCHIRMSHVTCMNESCLMGDLCSVLHRPARTLTKKQCVLLRLRDTVWV